MYPMHTDPVSGKRCPSFTEHFLWALDDTEASRDCNALASSHARVICIQVLLKALSRDPA